MAEMSTVRSSQILDSAWDLFVAQGIAATTMAEIAAGAEMSRVWLYRHYANRDAVVDALIRREVTRFLEGLEEAVIDERPLVDIAVESGLFALSFLRNHPLLQRLLQTEPESILPFLTIQAGPLFASAVEMTVPYLEAYGLPSERAAMTAEVVIRLVGSLVLTPIGVDDAERMLTEVIEALLT